MELMTTRKYLGATFIDNMFASADEAMAAAEAKAKASRRTVTTLSPTSFVVAVSAFGKTTHYKFMVQA